MPKEAEIKVQLMEGQATKLERGSRHIYLIAIHPKSYSYSSAVAIEKALRERSVESLIVPVDPADISVSLVKEMKDAK